MSYTIAIDETMRGLFATWRMFLRDARAASLFQNNYSAVLRSYWAIAVILPVYLLSAAIEYATPSDNFFNFGRLAAEAGLGRAVLSEICIFALCWFVVWPLVVDRLAGVLDCERNFLRYVAAYNWMHVPYALVGLVFWIGEFAGIVHAGNRLAVSMTLLATIWAYHWFVLRHVLGVTGVAAAVLVAMEYVLVVTVMGIVVSVAL